MLLTRRVALYVSCLVLSSGLVACAATTSSGSQAPAGASQGEVLARQKCTMCHTYDRVQQAKKDAVGWQSTIDRMVSNGLRVTDEERTQITEYLVQRDQP